MGKIWATQKQQKREFVSLTPTFSDEDKKKTIQQKNMLYTEQKVLTAEKYIIVEDGEIFFVFYSLAQSERAAFLSPRKKGGNEEKKKKTRKKESFAKL